MGVTRDVVRAGDGATKPVAGQTVTVHYTGVWQADSDASIRCASTSARAWRKDVPPPPGFARLTHGQAHLRTGRSSTPLAIVARSSASASAWDRSYEVCWKRTRRTYAWNGPPADHGGRWTSRNATQDGTKE
eukprot:scaffold2858_cov659-Pavlova_lutheri.AAC.108